MDSELTRRVALGYTGPGLMRQAVKLAMAVVRASDESVDLAVAVRGDEFLGAKDDSSRDSRDMREWQMQYEAPFDVVLVEGVSLPLAEELVDFGTPASGVKNGRQAWNLVRALVTKRLGRIR